MFNLLCKYTWPVNIKNCCVTPCSKFTFEYWQWQIYLDRSVFNPFHVQIPVSHICNKQRRLSSVTLSLSTIKITNGTRSMNGFASSRCITIRWTKMYSTQRKRSKLMNKNDIWNIFRFCKYLNKFVIISRAWCLLQSPSILSDFFKVLLTLSQICREFSLTSSWKNNLLGSVWNQSTPQGNYLVSEVYHLQRQHQSARSPICLRSLCPDPSSAYVAWMKLDAQF